MSTLTYCKGLPTPIEELNPLGYTEFELFLSAYAKVFRQAALATVEHLQTIPKASFDKAKWNACLQHQYRINKRHANGVIASAIGRLESAKECRVSHIKQLEGRLKSAIKWLASSVKKIKLAVKFYAKKAWIKSKTGTNFPLSCDLTTRKTNWSKLKFAVHHKRRYAYKLVNQISHLKTAPVEVSIPHGDLFVVGSKDESCGNQVVQWDGNLIKFRVPTCLEPEFGKSVTTQMGSFDRTIDRLPSNVFGGSFPQKACATTGAKTWHFYRKEFKWVAAVQFTPSEVKQISRSLADGCIGIDLNPGSIGWAYVDCQGNLTAAGKIPFQTGLSTHKQDAQIVDACLQLAVLAQTYSCPIVCEKLDFRTEKATLREKGRKYARMLSGWAYARFFELLNAILANRGINLHERNPAYTSVIGLVKYVRMYGLSSDVAAAIAIARRGMNLSERLPRSMSAYLGVNPRKHVWSAISQLNKFIGRCSKVNRRHDYYSISNWSLLVKDNVEQVN